MNILTELKKVANNTRNWKDINKTIPVGSPSTKPLAIAKKAHDLFFFCNYNNIGLPCIESKNKGTRLLEKLLLKEIISKTELKGLDGYITSGGTEGNMMGLWLARELFENKDDILVVKTELTHYSVEKSCRILLLRNVINIQLNEEYSMDLDKLGDLIKNTKMKNVIILVTLGYTTTGTEDDLEKIVSIIKKSKNKNYYIHIDAALGGFPLIITKKNKFLLSARKYVMSISIDGHKMGFMPYPGSIFLFNKNLINIISKQISYLGRNDATIIGSRTGVSAAMMYATWKKIGIKGYRRKFEKAERNKKYFIKKIGKKAKIIAKTNIPLLALEFEKPLKKNIEDKYGLVQSDIPKTINTPQKKAYKIYFMPTTSKKVLHELIRDIGGIR